MIREILWRLKICLVDNNALPRLEVVQQQTVKLSIKVLKYLRVNIRCYVFHRRIDH